MKDLKKKETTSFWENKSSYTRVCIKINQLSSHQKSQVPLESCIKCSECCSKILVFCILQTSYYAYFLVKKNLFFKSNLKRAKYAEYSKCF